MSITDPAQEVLDDALAQLQGELGPDAAPRALLTLIAKRLGLADRDTSWELEHDALADALGELREVLEERHAELEDAAEDLRRVVVHLQTSDANVGRARDRLVDMLMVDTDLLDPIPTATMAQSRRQAAHRSRLLASGALSVAALAEARETTESAINTWLSRQRKGHLLVTVKDGDGRTWVPAVLLDTSGTYPEPWKDNDRVLRPLVHAGLDGWATWTWLTTPSPWLDGQVPGELLGTSHLDRAADAAQRFTAAGEGSPSAA